MKSGPNDEPPYTYSSISYTCTDAGDLILNDFVSCKWASLKPDSYLESCGSSILVLPDLYVIGGRIGKIDFGRARRVRQIPGAKTCSVKRLKDMLLPCDSMGLAILKNSILYSIGGYQASTNTYVAACQKHIIRTNSWLRMPELNYPRELGSCIIPEGIHLLYVIGGEKWGETWFESVTEIEVLDTASEEDGWKKILTSRPVAWSNTVCNFNVGICEFMIMGGMFR